MSHTIPDDAWPSCGPLLTVAEAAHRLAHSKPTIRRWIERGLLDKVRIGSKSVRVPLASVERLIAAGTSAGK
jgi:excisionase family DNA binding protein